MDRIEAELASADLEGCGISLGRCVELWIDRADRRLWSPHLSLQVEESEEGSVLNARFSPRPEIWTFFMFLYISMATLTFLGAALAYAQWVIGDSLWGLVVAVLGGVVIGLLHAASRIGQRLSRQQMELLRSRLETILRRALPEDFADQAAVR
jgi:hypothetical protein